MDGLCLQLPTLEHRRNLNRITILYKITNNLIAVDPKLYLTPQPYLNTRNNNPLQYQIISTRTNYYKYSFFPHAVVHRKFIFDMLEVNGTTSNNTTTNQQDNYRIGKKYWKYVKSRKGETVGVSTLKVNGETIENSKRKSRSIE